MTKRQESHREHWTEFTVKGFVQVDHRIPVVGGLLVAILLHLLLFLVLPAEFLKGKAREVPPELTVEVLPDPERESRFVETNPDVPENEPDTTRNFAARSQQAAQEEATEEPLGDAPKTEGEVDDSQTIVEGSLDEPLPSGGAAATPTQESEAIPQESLALVVPNLGAPPLPPEFLREEPVEENGLGPVVVKEESKIESEDPRVIALNTDAPEPSTASVPVPIDTVEPLARPRLNPQVIPGLVRNAPTRVSRLGRVAIDAQFSEFGEYTQRMIEAISVQWHTLGDNFNHSVEDLGAYVKIEFNLTPEGRVEDLIVKETSASRSATLLCKDAILSRAPFNKWSEEMMAMLGDSDRVKVTFHYR